MLSRIRLFRWLLYTAFAVAMFGARSFAAEPVGYPLAGGKPPIYVVFWFDTEDYLLPADDDAALKIADMLTERGIRATFKLVGEKARVLEKRGRRDVINAIKRHDIGYHTNFHSVHPTPAEYLADCGFLEGTREFIRREQPGADDVRRIFGVPRLSCYGQPGRSWGSQTLAAMPSMSIGMGAPTCLDEGDCVGLDGVPFWYCRALMAYHLAPNFTRMDLKTLDGLEPAKQNFAGIAERLRGQGGGLISIPFHPNEWVHMEFWDAVNFAKGANPPRSEWKPPRQRPAEETTQLFHEFALYLDFIRAQEGVRFVTAADLPRLYPDRAREKGASTEDFWKLVELVAAAPASGLDFAVIGDRAYSPADQFFLLTAALDEIAKGKPLEFPRELMGLFGPDEEPPVSRENVTAPWSALATTAADARSYCVKNQGVPPRVFIGPEAIPPADFLIGAARALAEYHKGMKPPGEVALGKGIAIATARRVATETPDLFGKWPIHPEGFRPGKILDVARLQAWSLKPAIRKDEPLKNDASKK